MRVWGVQVREAGGTYVSCTVEVGGKISSRKGVNTPTVVLPISAMSDKDRKDAVFAKSLVSESWGARASPHLSISISLSLCVCV